MKTTVTTGWAGDAYKMAFKTEMLDAYLNSANNIATTARSLVHKKSGAMASTIRAGKSVEQNAAFVFAGSIRDRIYYAHMLEYGTYDRPAHPFMRPAMDSNFNSTLAEADRAGKRILNKERRMNRK